MFTEFWKNIFYALLAESVVGIVALIVKEDKRRQVQILVFGTIIAGLLAFAPLVFGSNTSSINIPSPTNGIAITPKSRTPTVPPVTNTPTIDPTTTYDFTSTKTSLTSTSIPDLGLIFLSPLGLDIGYNGATLWSIGITCHPTCARNHRIYWSLSDLDIDSSKWKELEVNTQGRFDAAVGYWYKVEVVNPPDNVIYIPEKIYCCNNN